MTEYLVEVAPGREQAYRSPLAFRAAMRTGEITADSRIYHRAASRWIPITEHPEYRRFLAERRPPDWLQPIPFEPVQPGPSSIQGRRALVAVKAALARAGAALRDRLSRLGKPAPKPPAATNDAVPASPPRRAWTFMP